MFRTKKWICVRQLIQKLNDADDPNYEELKGDLKLICYAPHIGYFERIFSYKGVLVVLTHSGNGYYTFFSMANLADVIVGFIQQTLLYRKAMLKIKD